MILGNIIISPECTYHGYLHGYHIKQGVYMLPCIKMGKGVWFPKDVYSFGNMRVEFTRINEELFLPMHQINNLLQLSPQTIRQHIDGVSARYLSNCMCTEGATANIQLPHWLIVYLIPIKPGPEAKTGKGCGGTQYTKFYHHELVVDIASCMRNGQTKDQAILWLRDVIATHVQHGGINKPRDLTVNQRVSHHRGVVYVIN